MVAVLMKSSHLLLLAIYFGALVVVLSLLFRFVRRFTRKALASCR